MYSEENGSLCYRICKRVFDIVFNAGIILMLAVPVAVTCVVVCCLEHFEKVHAQGVTGRGVPEHISPGTTQCTALSKMR